MTFIVFKVDNVMRCTSSAWMVVASKRAFCSSQNCTVRSSSMRLSSSTGSSVGAIHCPTLGIAAPAFLTRSLQELEARNEFGQCFTGCGHGSLA